MYVMQEMQKEEYLSGYEQIMINTDLLLVSTESRGVLNGFLQSVIQITLWKSMTM